MKSFGSLAHVSWWRSCTHLGGWVLRGSLAAATAAYLMDKNVLHSIHPRLPRWLGLRLGFYPLEACASADEARSLLLGAAAAWPVLPPQRAHGRWALDGGYMDNAPVPAQTMSEKAGTLVLLSRHYPKLPTVFRWRERFYWQPSRPVPVSTWDCRSSMVNDTSAAFALGRADAETALDSSAMLNGKSRAGAAS